MAKKNTIPSNLKAILTDLPEDVSIEKIETHPHSLELFVSWNEPPIGQRYCPSCGGNHCVKKDSGIIQTVRHLPIGLKGTLITFHKPRYLCKDCGKTFYLKPSWLIRDISITYPLLLSIYSRLASSSHSITDIARETHVSPSIIQNVLKHFEMPHPKTLPETLGIDEFHGSTGTYNASRKRYDTEKFHCVLTDADGGFVIDVLYKATYAELLPYFNSFPLYERQKVHFFCTDMRSGFSKIARRCFPNAKICIDPFHVVKLLTEAVSTVRIDVWRKLRDQAALIRQKAEEAKACGDLTLFETLSADAKHAEEDVSLVKNSQRLLITSPYNETRYWNRRLDLKDERLSRIFSLSTEIETAYNALQEFYEVASCDTFSSRRKALTEWLQEYLPCECPPVRQAAHSIKIRRKGIENAWRYHKSNSPTEGLNKKIKDVKRLAFGAHSFENFRKRVLLACGGDSFRPDFYTIFGEKNATGDSSFLKEKQTEQK